MELPLGDCKKKLSCQSLFELLAVNIKMSVKCVKCPFVTAPEEMDEHMNLCHRSTRSVTQALLREVPVLGNGKKRIVPVEESPKEQSEMLVRKRKKR